MPPINRFDIAMTKYVELVKNQTIATPNYPIGPGYEGPARLEHQGRWLEGDPCLGPCLRRKLRHHTNYLRCQAGTAFHAQLQRRVLRL